jgi:hypothetical protein
MTWKEIFMNQKKALIKMKADKSKEVPPLHPKSMYKEGDIVDVENGVDIYFAQGKTRYQLSRHASPFYSGEEYSFTGTLVKGEEVCFTHRDGTKIPVHENSNCGYTLVGNARKYFEAKRALCANGEASDDQEYIYINKHSELYYVGETEEHTIFIRVYDNANGINNDRWVVIYIS